jgi:hypothetical protein
MTTNKFEKNYCSFYNEVKLITPQLFENDQSESEALFAQSDNSNTMITPLLNFFITNWYQYTDPLSTANYDYFETHDVSPLIFPNVRFLTLMKLLSDENKNIVWGYLHTLYIFSYSMITRFTEYPATLEEHISLNKSNYETYLHNIISWKRNNMFSAQSSQSSTSANQPNNSNQPNTDQNQENKLPDILTNTTIGPIIGNVCDEISKELNEEDMTEIKKSLEDPSNFLKSLMSNNQENNCLNKILKSVSSKVNDKFTSGEIKQEDVMNDVGKILNMLPGLNKEGKNGMPDLSGLVDIMKTFTNLGGGGDMPDLGNLSDLASMFNNLKTKKNSEKSEKKKKKKNKSKK